MTSARLSDKELTDLIFYGVIENNLDPKDIGNIDIKIILAEYHELCSQFQTNYVRGELDTFKRAACLLIAINNRKLCLDNRINASIALDAAYKMCEIPYWNVGKNFDIPEKMEEVNFKQIFEDEMEIYETSKNMLIDSLVYEKGTPLNYHLNLQLLYEVALTIKHADELKETHIEMKKDEEIEEPIIKEEKPKSLVRRLFNKKRNI